MPGGAHENMKAWEPEEDEIIMTMVAQEGPKWKSIVTRLPGRTVSSVRNRYQRIEKGRKLREDGVDLKNRCHACGQPKRGHICAAKRRGGPQMDLPTPIPAALALGVGGDNPAPLLMMAETDVPPLYAHPTSAGRSAPPSASSIGHPSQPPLKRTRSGSRLVPDYAAGNGEPSYTVDVAAVPNAIPPLMRNNTSFFNDLAQAGDLFSPGSREMFAAWADDNGPPTSNQPGSGSLMAQVANDEMAPPSLRRVASREVSEVPKVTRSVASYLREYTEDGPHGVSPLVPSGAAELRRNQPSGLSRQPSGLSRQPSNLSRMLDSQPSVSRQVSNPMPDLGRSVTSFMRDFIDESATLESAPPASALPSLSAMAPPPPLQSPLDLGGGGAFGMPPPGPLSAVPPALTSQLSLEAGLFGGPPSISRRNSPRLGSPRLS